MKPTHPWSPSGLYGRHELATCRLVRRVERTLSQVHRPHWRLAPLLLASSDTLGKLLQALREQQETAEVLADQLHSEQLAHLQTREALAEATRRLEELSGVEETARALLRVVDRPTSPEEEGAQFRELTSALAELALALHHPALWRVAQEVSCG